MMNVDALKKSNKNKKKIVFVKQNTKRISTKDEIRILIKYLN
jgi:hypothetical protein